MNIGMNPLCIGVELTAAILFMYLWMPLAPEIFAIETINFQ